MNHSDCEKLFQASKALLAKSKLASWNGACFVACSNETKFSEDWKNTFDPKFGRHMAWVCFSVGAENLVKAACICRGVSKRKVGKLGYPVYSASTEKEGWVQKVLNPQKGTFGDQEAAKYDYGTLRSNWIDNGGIDKLSEQSVLIYKDRAELRAAYKYLTEVIINRDAHTYISAQRGGDFPAVQGVFVPAFNTLVRTMKDNEHPL